MARGIKFSISGTETATRRLHELPMQLQKKGLPRAARSAMKIVRDAARASAQALDDPDTRQKIWTLIQIKRGRLNGPGIRMRVGIAGGARSSRAKDHPWYWRLIELGSERQRARPFLRPALENNTGAVADRFVRELNVELDILAETER